MRRNRTTKLKEKFGLREIYKFYKSKFTPEERACSSFVDYKTYSNILKDFNKEMIRLIIEEGVEFKLPVRLGFLRVKKYKKNIRLNPDGSVNTKSLKVDWNESIKLWKREYPDKDMDELKQIKGKPLVYHLNNHTDGYNYLFYWSKKGSNAKNRGIYSAILTNVNNRYLARVLKDENKTVEYYE